MRILVTGATGYLGQAVVHELVSDGHQVTALLHRSRGPWNGSVSRLNADLLDPVAMLRAVADVDAVCHLAALTRVRHSQEAPGDYRRLNSGAVTTLLDALVQEHSRSERWRPLVFLSSGAVYGGGDRPLRETDPVAPRSVYGATKLAAEREVAARTGTGAFGAATLRLFSAAGLTTTGIGPDPSTVISQTLLAAQRGHAVSVNGDGGTVRDFVHVRDVADAVALALAASRQGEARTYNLGAAAATIRQIVETAREVTGRSIPVEHRLTHPGDAPRLVADTRAARTELGWKPTRSDLSTMVAEQWHALHGA
ncbi:MULTISPECIES: NAD-dependent epimerase/dehydratase family protein [Streptomyces]|uniref:NAD-dependent epimerase/dehydratase family protein n=1 Tax=Streptomyces TaxID=1883 RepID=UPI00369A3EB7